MNKIYYDIEFNHIIKNYIIPKINEFQKLMDYIYDKFEYLEFVDKVTISEMFDDIYTLLHCNFDDVIYFNSQYICVSNEEKKSSLNELTFPNSQKNTQTIIKDYDIDEEEKYHRENKILDDDNLYCNKIMNNSSSSICNQSFEVDEVF